MSRLAFTHFHLVDGCGSSTPDMTVLVQDGQIERVGSSDQVEFDRPSYDEIKGEGFWLLPGLINCHDHLMDKSLGRRQGSEGAWRHDFSGRPPGFQALECAKNAVVELSQGVTTIRDLAGPNMADQRNPGYTNVDLRDAIAAGMPGPRILACRLAVTMTGGHGYPWFAIREADGPDEVRKAVREQLKGGADFIKIMSSGGFSHYPHEDPEATQFTVDELRAAAEEAHRQGRLITTHAIADQGARNAIEAGIDTIEHGFLLTEETVDRMAAQGTTFVPTVRVMVRMQAGKGPLAEFTRTVVPSHVRAVRQAMAAGIPIGAGTDSRAFMVDELEALVSVYHFSPMEALVAATGSAARICGLQQVGTVEAGKLADLLIVGTDPLKGIREGLQDVRAVYKEGLPQLLAAEAIEAG